ncbi:hypothetical protein FCU45_02430 [Sulfurimonas crateris]|uniref:Uncharacterized protein n=1 Tax=Sulfurimonas crateris TaxID=2574727 RepID=A0A4U2Z9T2_9BACT|nr:hypothetical protein [Sulfurimonas crateris]TKI71256.1 hypothetical protein FCU45_02430 [Sulfurimonas crateris]
MKNNIIFNILLSIGAGYLLAELQSFLGTTYLTNFLKQNLITLLVALIAINSATLSIVLTKVRELLDKSGQQGAFGNTKKQMILSVNEQVILIVVAMLLLIVQDSDFIKLHVEYVTFLNVLIIGCFVYALRILHDTAKSVFVILDY